MTRNSAVFREWNLKSSVISLVVNRNGDWVAAALSNGDLVMLPATEDAETPKTFALHKGISLSLKPDADTHAFLSGGDDGKVFIIDPLLDAPNQIADHKGKWVDHVVGSADGKFRAYSIAKQVYLLNDEGVATTPAPLPSSAGGLAFSPNSKRLAASHYNGISLFWPNAKDTTATVLPWKGSHLNMIWHPDSKIVLTALQENSLHGWQLSDNREMRMEGYAAKIHSMDFTVKAKFLATAGADQVICWPFFGGGPWGKAPTVLGGSDNRLVAQVAAHPRDEMVAVGYDDGMIVLAPLDGRMEIMVHTPVSEAGAAVTGLVWNKEGDSLFAGFESGYIKLFTIASVKRSLTHA